MMTFSVAVQEVVSDGMRVCFGVGADDTSEVWMTVGTSDQDHFRLTFQRNGALRAVKHIEPEPAKAAEPTPPAPAPVEPPATPGGT